MDGKDSAAQLRSLVWLLAEKKVDSSYVIPAMAELAKGAVDIDALCDSLPDTGETTLANLRRQLWDARRKEALKWHGSRVTGAKDTPLLSGLPPAACKGWHDAQEQDISNYFAYSRCLRFIEKSLSGHLPRLRAKLSSQELDTSIERLASLARPALPSLMSTSLGIAMLEPVDKALSEAGKELQKGSLAQLLKTFAASAGQAARKPVLDQIASYPFRAAAAPLKEIMRDDRWAQERASLILTMRFGKEFASPSEWLSWLEREAAEEAVLQDNKELTTEYAAELVLAWYARQSTAEPRTIGMLKSICETKAAKLDAAGLLKCCGSLLDEEERALLLSIAESGNAAVSIPEPATPKETTAASAASSTEPAGHTGKPQELTVSGPTTAKEPPPAPRSSKRAPCQPAVAKPSTPSLWDTHLQPFLAENWYMFAGILMMLAGTSVLAYYTWDKHWLLRYTILPVILGSFTWGLAWSGSRLERRDRSLADMATMLRGAAMALLPVNFMALILLASDPVVTCKPIAVPCISLLYLSLGFCGLRSWCGKVHEGIASLLGNCLLMQNALIAAAALAIMSGATKDPERTSALLLAGSYICFAGLLIATLRFGQNVLDAKLAEEKRVPWFFGVMGSASFLQALLWTHCYLAVVPSAAHYAPLVILSGGLVFYAERRALELKGRSDLLGAESFIGFALLIAGLLMGNTDHWMRIVVFLLAGAVWIYQAAPRKNGMQQWLGLILLCCGVLSFGLLPAFPAEWRPALGLLLALLLGGSAAYLKRKPALESWSQACLGLQAAVLPLTAISGILSQWHYQSMPLATGALILAVCAGICLRCWKDRNAWWLHMALPLLALSLPYLGFAELPGLHRNNLDLGFSMLACAWLLAARMLPHEPLLKTRSLGAFFYAMLALAAIVFRTLFSGPHGGDGVTFATCALLGIAMIPCAWHTRSMLPMALALAGIILLAVEMPPSDPALASLVKRGSGLASLVAALLGVLLSLALERMKLFGSLTERQGDISLGGSPFPLQRQDHSLFSWPLLAGGLYLCLRGVLFCAFWDIAKGSYGLGTALVLGLAGLFWTLLAIHLRRAFISPFATHLGWISFSGAFFIAHWATAQTPHWEYPLLATFLLLQALHWLYLGVERRADWARRVLLNPTLATLRWGSLAVLAGILPMLLMGYSLETPICLLLAFLAAQMVWHGLSTRLPLHGTALFLALTLALISWFSPGSGAILARLSFQHTLTPLLIMALATFLAHILLERRPATYGHASPLLMPAHALALSLSLILGCTCLFDAFGTEMRQTILQSCLALLTLLLAARSQDFSLLALLAAFLCYGLASRAPQGATLSEHLSIVISPWRLGLFALMLAILGRAGHELRSRLPSLMAGPFPFKPLRLPTAATFYSMAFLLALFSAAYHLLDPALRNNHAQLAAPYLAAATVAIAALALSQKRMCFAIAALLCALGNIHLVHVCFGDWLIEHGLSHLHLVCLGLALLMIQTSLAKLFLRQRPAAETFLNQSAAACAGLALALLSFNYFAHPDLSKVAPSRFVVSAIVALLAALYFRQAARRPAPGEEKYVYVIEGFHHFGLALSMWCFALLLPFLRTPQTAMLALGLPAIYFFICAEAATRLKREVARNYRDSATVLCFALLGLYAFKLAFQMLLFPSAPLDTSHYHCNSPLLLALAPVMFRLHALGGSWWLAFYAGLSLVAGSFFLATWLPGLSPFSHQIAGAWAAIALGHFWTLASNARSPLRSAIQRLGAIGDEAWPPLRRAWGYCLLAAATLVSAIGLTMAASRHSLLFAPLLLGLASIYLHHGMLRRAWPYFAVAGTALLVALHADFLMPSYLPKDYVALALLALWAAFLIIERLLKNPFVRNATAPVSICLLMLSMPHILLQHRPMSLSGLWIAAGAALLAALSPVKSLKSGRWSEALLGVVPLLAPLWLVFFSQAAAPLALKCCGLDTNPVSLYTWPLLITAATALAMSLANAIGGRRLADRLAEKRGASHLHLALEQGIELAATHRNAIRSAVLWIVFPAVCLLQALHYFSPFASQEFALLLLLWAAFAWAWYDECRLRRSFLACAFAELALVALFLAVRRQLTLTTQFWNVEYDIWVSLVSSFALASFKRFFERQGVEQRLPALVSLCLLPVIALAWILIHHLGSNMALMVLGLHSVIFMFMGKDNRHSPFHFASVASFVSFVCLVFWAKLELRALNAYVLPTGIGILALVHLFRDALSRGSRTGIRFASVFAMMGSTAYYCLSSDPRIGMAHLAIMLALCIASMLMGTFMRIKVYFFAGFVALSATLGVFVAKVAMHSHLDSSVRMTLLGAGVLIAGISLIFGAVYVKTHKDALLAKFAMLKDRLGQWE